MTEYQVSQDRRRSADRILDTAEGVLIALRRYHLNQAFFELAQTAKRNGVKAVSLADALVALAQRQPTVDCEPRAVDVARETWGHLLDGAKDGDDTIGTWL
ncbi:hypothetical protein [Mycobacterium sp. IS-3022]|uniref:hypothetical protein n=1 Tax=Mycobacterium sp. IS-3022 TaxID=1772277 RepID=UPI000741571F|nr:hypothetical protein [Mycobacterium sp. IS-3022]KUI02465.1 hypothetical protein AU188_06085 [Mycobacterium sp. IS-3022]